jgi:hypothetical protein
MLIIYKSHSIINLDIWEIINIVFLYLSIYLLYFRIKIQIKKQNHIKSTKKKHFAIFI